MSTCLYDCLCEAKLGQYYSQFKSAGIVNSETLSMLSMEDYTLFGVYQMDDRKRLFQLIQIIKNVQSANQNTASDERLSHNKKKRKNGTISKELCKSLPVASERDMLNLNASCDVEPKQTVRDTSPRASQQFRGLVTPKRSRNLPISHKSQKKNMSPQSLSKLEKKGGVLFVSPSANNNKDNKEQMKVTRKKLSVIRESLSDSELLEDTVLSHHSNSLVDISQLKKENYVGTVFHNNGYNYGVPDGREKTPNTKNRSKQCNMLNTTTNLCDELSLRQLAATPKIVVCVRKRPVNRRELQNKEVNVVEIDGRSSVLVNEVKTTLNMTKFVQEHKFHFDEVFHEKSSNEEVYGRTARPLLHTLFNKGKATCFAYGQTGAGKTHTMMGNEKVKGLYLLAAQDIFHLQESGKFGDGITIWTSYFEIYCGNLFDLLNNRQRLHAREDAQHRVNIVELKEVQVLSADGLLQVVEHGNRIRSKGCSGVNSSSSRSHAVLQIELKDPSKHTIGRLSFIDLAGSERACDTVDPDKLTRIEGAEINTSLLALKECIRALDQEQKHTPFRQSKLTQVLKDSFLGNSRTCMIANVSPNIGSTEHTLNTLRYADRVKELRKEPVFRSGNTPKARLKSHPPTPTTFTPPSTSTPMKTSKKIATPKSHNSATKHVNHSLDDPSYISKDAPIKTYGATPQRSEVNVRLHSKRSFQTNQKVALDSPRGHSGSSRNQSKPSVALPVWQPIQTEEAEVIRTPNQKSRAWEVNNDRYLLNSNGHKTDSGDGDNTMTSGKSVVHKEPHVEAKERSLGDTNWYLRNNSNKMKEVMSPSQRDTKDEAKASTNELLAEIEKALKNSVVKLSPEASDQLYSATSEKNEHVELTKDRKAPVGKDDNDLLLTSPIVLKQRSLMSLGEMVQSSFDSVSTDSLNRHPSKSVSQDINANIEIKSGNSNDVSEGSSTNFDNPNIISQISSKKNVNSRSLQLSMKGIDNHSSPRSLPTKQAKDQFTDISREVSLENSPKPNQLPRANSFPKLNSYRSLRTRTLSARKLDFAMEVLTKAMNPVKKESVKMTTFAEQRMKSNLWRNFQTICDTRDIPDQTQYNSANEPNSENNQTSSVTSISTKKEDDDGIVSDGRSSELKSTMFVKHSPVIAKLIPSVTSAKSDTNGREFTPYKHPLPTYQCTPIVKECLVNKSQLMDQHLNSPVVQEKVPATEQVFSRRSDFTSQKDCTLTNGFTGAHEPFRPEVNNKQDFSTAGNIPEPVRWQPVKEDDVPPVISSLSTHQMSRSAIGKAQTLLFLTHAQQLEEMKSLCDRETDLINEAKTGEIDFFEYLTMTQTLQETKLHRIQTFKDQLETFYNISSPEISPAASMNSSFHW